MFQRTDDYMTKITLLALDKHVMLDANIEIRYLGSKLKAYCKETDTYVQFPREIRKPGKKFIADVVKAQRGEDQIFYRAATGSIRDAAKGPTSDPIA